MMKKLLYTLFIPLLIILSAASFEEGMFPLSEISNLDLKKAGLRIDTKEIFNPDGASLVDALVRVGGCTGSFVSEEGLIITNHHCAFGSIASASTPENDYLANGFMAEFNEKEIPTNITARITRSYQDVSDQILTGVSATTDPGEKATIIQENIKRITEEEQNQNPDLLIEISEMFQGKSYTLFRYEELKDIRLVYAPPRSIGEFGGETDNWVWPRHTGDFSFFRAYMAPDGSSANFDVNNIPFTPKKHLQINAEGLKENDFAFILGYPGRTFRNQPSQFLDYQYEYFMPYISEWYDFQIEAMERISEGDRDKELKFASRKKSLANVSKNYKGKIQGLTRTDIIKNRKEDDAAMKQLIANDPDLKAQVGDVFTEIEEIYNDKFITAKRDLWLGQMFSSSGVMFAAAFIGEQSSQNDDIRKEDKRAFLEKKFPALHTYYQKNYQIYDAELEATIIKKLLYEGQLLPEDQRPASLNQFSREVNPESAINDFVDQSLNKTALADAAYINKLFLEQPEEFLKIRDPLIEIAQDCFQELMIYQEKEKIRQQKLTDLLPKLIEVRQKYKQSEFLPDANGTLRLTYGHIRGYRPVDAEYHEPFTTVKGILQKSSEEGDYFLEEEINTLLQSDPETIVCMLYDMDTTGGNSGSPILDADGKLVGVNFDRAFTATINDFAWNEEYSRSIGVDIRYVIFILKNLSKAENILQEMGVGMEVMMETN
ncbi:S46 family peptidase [soil metagenome]